MAKNNSQLITVTIIEDHQLVAEGLQRMINESRVAAVAEVYHDIQTSLTGITADTQPDVLLLDIGLPDGNGIDFCEELTKAFPKINIIMLTMYNEITFVKRSLMAGAKGYLLKNSSSSEVIEAIKTVFFGGTYINKEIEESLNNQETNENQVISLNRREKEVLRYIVTGYSDTRIAKEMCLSGHTVRDYRKHLLQKFGVHTTIELGLKAKSMMMV
jgi:DNA-binding NarL/FixJ family response regulator